MSEVISERHSSRHHSSKRKRSRESSPGTSRERKSRHSERSSRKRKRSRESSSGRPRKRARDEDRFEERRKKNKLEEINDFVEKEIIALLEAFKAVKKGLSSSGLLEMAQKDIDFEKIEKNRYLVNRSTKLVELSGNQQTNNDDRPKTLLVDEHGREVDEAGRIIQTVPLVPNTLKVNIKLQNKARMKREKELKRNSVTFDNENPYFDPKVMKFTKRQPRPSFNWVMPGTMKNKMDTTSSQIEDKMETDIVDSEIVEKDDNMENIEKKENNENKENKDEENRKKEFIEQLKIDDDTEFNMDLLKFEKLMLLPDIPPVEWWDADYLLGKKIEGAEDLKDYGKEEENIPINESNISSLIEKPVPIPPPNEKKISLNHKFYG